MRLNDALLGLVILLGGLAIILEASTFPATHGQDYGPDFFPTIIGLGLVLSGIGLMVTGWRHRAATGWIDVAGHRFDRLIDAGLVLLVILAFILFLDRVGFVLVAGIGMYVLLVRFRGGAWLSSLLITVVLILVVDWAFRAMLLVPLPQGTLLPRLPW